MKASVSIRRESIINKLNEIDENCRIGIYGAGEHTKNLLELTDLRNKNVITLIDKYVSHSVKDLPTISPEKINKYNLDIIIVSSLNNQAEINDFLVNKVNYQGKILNLYSKSDVLPFYSN